MAISPLYFVLVTFVLAISGFRLKTIYKRRRQLRQLPFIEIRDGDYKAALLKASKEYPSTPYVIQTGGWNNVVLPNGILDEVRRIPDALLSERADLYEKMHGRWTDVGGPNQEIAFLSLKKDLTNNLGRLLPDIQDEVQYGLDKYFGSFRDWTQIPLYHRLAELSASVNGRFFVGSQLCRDNEWRNLYMTYAQDISGVIRAVEPWHWLIRPLAAPFMKDVRRMQQVRQHAARLLTPYVDAAVEQRRKREEAGISKDDEGDHLIDWMLNHMDTSKPVDMLRFAREHIMVGAGAINLTSIASTNIFYDLAAHPEYIIELRAEIDEALASQPNRIMTRNSLPKMLRLDSLIYESLRMSSQRLTSRHRVVKDPSGIRISTGHVLPYGTSVCWLHPQAPWSTPPADLDIPTEKASLDEFYPFRYSDRRVKPGQESSFQVTTTGRDNIHFGHGQGACPGRWFAVAILKIIVIEVIQRYDLALGPGGEGKSARYPRPKGIMVQGSLRQMPDFAGTVYLKDRENRV